MICPSRHQPLESLAVRWRQRSRSAAGCPLSSRNSMMFSPRSVNGCGPAASLSSGSVAYQNRRSTFCLVASMGVSPVLLVEEPRHHAGCLAPQSFEVETGNRAVLDDDTSADHQQLEVGRAGADHRSDQFVVQAEITR